MESSRRCGLGLEVACASLDGFHGMPLVCCPKGTPNDLFCDLRSSASRPFRGTDLGKFLVPTRWLGVNRKLGYCCQIGRRWRGLQTFPRPVNSVMKDYESLRESATRRLVVAKLNKQFTVRIRFQDDLQGRLSPKPKPIPAESGLSAHTYIWTSVHFYSSRIVAESSQIPSCAAVILTTR